MLPASPNLANPNANAVLPPGNVPGPPGFGRVGRAAKRANTAVGMRVPLVTNVEIGQQVVSMVEESLAVLPGAPAAGIPAAVAARGAALAALVGVPAALAANTAALAANTAALAALAAKFANSLAVDEADLLTPVADALGAPVPVIFPATRGAFHALSAANCDVLLAYYGAPIPPAAILVRPRRALLRPHLGLTRVHID